MKRYTPERFGWPATMRLCRIRSGQNNHLQFRARTFVVKRALDLK
jgi:hypothetical protein